MMRNLPVFKKRLDVNNVMTGVCVQAKAEANVRKKAEEEARIKAEAVVCICMYVCMIARFKDVCLQHTYGS